MDASAAAAHGATTSTTLSGLPKGDGATVLTRAGYSQFQWIHLSRNALSR